MRIYIGGGTGFVGRHLQSKLTGNGHSVVLISRNAGPKNNISWMQLQRDGLPKDCEAIVNLAGENLMNPAKRWNEDFKSSLKSSRIDTTKFIADLISKSDIKPKVWVSSSAIGFYKHDEKVVYDENSKGGRGDFLSELCSEWEKAAITDPSVRQAVVRIGLVLGRDGGTIQQMYIPFFFGLGGKIASGKQWFPWVHVTDVAGIFAHAIENENVHGVLNAVSPNITTNEEFTKSFARAMWRPALFPVPEAFLKLIYGSERASVITNGLNVFPKRTLESGYKFDYPDIDLACKEFSRFLVAKDLRF